MTLRIGKVFALALVLGVLQVQMLAAPSIMGTLRTRDNKPVLVNGNKVNSGTTIVSGSRIQSPEKTGATVEIASLGRLDFAPKTDFVVTFEASKITVRLKAGYVVLTTKQGISGIVTTPDGKAFETDSSKLSSVVARTAGALGPEASVPIGAAGGLSTGAAAATVGGAGAAVVGGAAAAGSNGRGSDLSTDRPQPQR
jgi:hypothetical protein